MANTTGKKFGGRKKGVTNKQTVEIRDAYKMLVEGNLEHLDNWIKEIADENPKEAIAILLKLSEFVVPKLKSVELTSTSIDELLLMTRQQRAERIKELQSKHHDR